MVQVDIFWSYGLGAGFAMAAHRQLLLPPEADNNCLAQSPFFTHALLFLSLFFAPSGICLLWAFTNWETMQVFTYDTLPTWLVTGFAITNITQGILGFWVVRFLLRIGKPYFAFLQVVFAYFMLFFILVHGWDGTGYQRFFSYDQAAFANWGARPPMENVLAWLVGPVAFTLYGMGVVMLPWMLGLISRWLMQGYQMAGTMAGSGGFATGLKISVRFLALVFVHSLGSAIGASLLIHWLGWLGGGAAFLVLLYVILLRRGGLTYRCGERLMGITFAK